MKKPVVLGLGLAILGTAGIVAAQIAGSTPEEPGFDGPLPLCNGVPNCYRVRRVYSASPDVVRDAARAAVDASSHWLTGAPVRVTPTDDGLKAVIKTGPFRDDLQIAVVPGAAGQSVLHARSASRVGESDLGINRLRVRRLLDAVADRLMAA
ncbi:MAG: hypothetical protein Rubg2KO_03430 [Rubricoccaceae bacterium]